MTLIALAPSPALDVTHRIGALADGGIHRPTEVVRLAGGKALNVVRAARALGLPARAVVPLGGRMGVVVAGLAVDEGLDVRAVPIAAEARQCLSLVPDAGSPTESYEPAPELSAREARSLASAVGEELAGALAGEAIGDAAVAAVAPAASARSGGGSLWGSGAAEASGASEGTAAAGPSTSPDASTPAAPAGPVWLAISGSLPPALIAGLGPVVEAALAAGVRLAVDSSGEGLRALLEARPHVVKVNRSEAAGALELPEQTPLRELAGALRTLTSRPDGDGGLVVVTDGAHGALALDADGAWLAHPDPEPGRFAVGSGDSFLAGLVAGLSAGETTASALARASAAGSANTRALGAGRFSADDVAAATERIRVEALDS
ncbi:hypothetical protein GCM10027515_16840 [Schumannella luteola]|uniref:Fructose-1-phosphate kinase PfkB-like protein n=1 Tax=Schumannella luteola TaxID=472059 RepID=A0A852YC25_9MICO|nr:PfkB family carbohydrate kinase [Schumannella luteola]NYH00517.1 fructose-1-phosphate kinase PfkB-like protein [Schumannella luteola]TPX06227.1 hypothetical protein FJ656_02210 [Schumannella luteola]